MSTAPPELQGTLQMAPGRLLRHNIAVRTTIVLQVLLAASSATTQRWTLLSGSVPWTAHLLSTTVHEWADSTGDLALSQTPSCRLLPHKRHSAKGAQDKKHQCSGLHTAERQPACRNCFTSEGSIPTRKTPQAKGVYTRSTTKNLHAIYWLCCMHRQQQSQETTGAPLTCSMQQQAPRPLWLRSNSSEFK